MAASCVMRDGEIVAIVEERDASDEIKLIDEINTGVYLFDIDALRTVLQS